MIARRLLWLALASLFGVGRSSAAVCDRPSVSLGERDVSTDHWFVRHRLEWRDWEASWGDADRERL